MASSSNETNTSVACCNTAVPAKGHTCAHTGHFEPLADTKCYITGPPDATKGIFYLYDVLGFQPPTLQGADLLATRGYIVIMPDLLPEPLQMEWLDLPPEERQAKTGPWMVNIADSKPHIARILTTLDAAKKRYSGVKVWGSMGFCWGGKLVALTSGADTPWAVGVQSSPGRIDAADAEKATIPTMMLNSKDEPNDAVAAFSAALKVPKVVERFDTQIHGWMSARANLDDAHASAAYFVGYGMALAWFSQYLR